jgi:hypothetical protein
MLGMLFCFEKAKRKAEATRMSFWFLRWTWQQNEHGQKSMLTQKVLVCSPRSQSELHRADGQFQGSSIQHMPSKKEWLQATWPNPNNFLQTSVMTVNSLLLIQKTRNAFFVAVTVPPSITITCPMWINTKVLLTVKCRWYNDVMM